MREGVFFLAAESRWVGGGKTEARTLIRDLRQSPIKKMWVWARVAAIEVVGVGGRLTFVRVWKKIRGLKQKPSKVCKCWCFVLGLFKRKRGKPR